MWVEIELDQTFAYLHEVRREPDLTGMPLYSAAADGDVAELVEEASLWGVLAGRLPAAPDALQVQITPHWVREPIIGSLEITLAARRRGKTMRFVQRFPHGRWFREAQRQLQLLRDQKTVGPEETVYSMLLALACDRSSTLRLAPFPTPCIAARSLAACGVRTLGAGRLLADRPVLVNQTLIEDTLRKCCEADTRETGGAVLGQMIRLDQALPGTTTRIVTVLSASVDDHRHAGDTMRFTFDPAALAAAAQIAELRGLGETVQTVYHTHGWKNACGNCNQNPRCPLAEADPSLQDYQLIESLFPSKSTLLPIAGRKLGAPGRSPVLRIHAWRGGRLQAIPWQAYSD
jgi:hypothetical protein